MSSKNLIALGVAAAISGAPAFAQTEFAKLVAADPGGEHQLGHSIALDGTWLAAGAPRDNHAGAWSGAAYVFQRDPAGWSQSAKVVAPDAAEHTRFGWSVDLEWPRLFVGAPQHDGAADRAGAVYVFEHDGMAGWVLDTLLVASDAAPCGELGEALDVEGSLLAVKAEQPCDSFDESVVYLFRDTGGTWVEEARLTATDPAYRAEFGTALLLHDGHLFVGAGLESSNAGILFEYEQIGGAWQQVDALRPALTAAQFNPGSLALEGDTLVVGIPSDWSFPSGPLYRGSAHVFVPFEGSWRHEAKLLPSDPSYFQRFGSAVALRGDLLLIGSEEDPLPQYSAGSVYAFERVGDEWLERNKFRGSDTNDHDWFGCELAIEGNTALVGARRADAPDPDEGAVYVFQLALARTLCAGDGSASACPCANGGASGAGCANSTGAGAPLTATGWSSVTLDDQLLSANSLPPGKPCLLIAGDAIAGGGAGMPFGDGLRCADGAVQRLVESNASALGGATFGPGLAGLAGFLAGDTGYFQLYYRDPAGPCGSGHNQTNALAIEFTP